MRPQYIPWEDSAVTVSLGYAERSTLKYDTSSYSTAYLPTFSLLSSLMGRKRVWDLVDITLGDGLTLNSRIPFLPDHDLRLIEKFGFQWGLPITTVKSEILLFHSLQYGITFGSFARSTLSSGVYYQTNWYDFSQRIGSPLDEIPYLGSLTARHDEFGIPFQLRIAKGPVFAGVSTFLPLWQSTRVATTTVLAVDTTKDIYEPISERHDRAVSVRRVEPRVEFFIGHRFTWLPFDLWP